MAAGNELRNTKFQYIGDRLTDHYTIFTEASCRYGTSKHHPNFGSDQNPRWPPEINTGKRKSHYLEDRFTDRHEIFTVASWHHRKPEKNNPATRR